MEIILFEVMPTYIHILYVHIYISLELNIIILISLFTIVNY